VSRNSVAGANYLTLNENPLDSFLARFAARFSIKVFCGFFLSCRFVSLPLLIYRSYMTGFAAVDMIAHPPHPAVTYHSKL
jgi:hypothetical protein